MIIKTFFTFGIFNSKHYSIEREVEMTELYVWIYELNDLKQSVINNYLVMSS